MFLFLSKPLFLGFPAPLAAIKAAEEMTQNIVT